MLKFFFEKLFSEGGGEGGEVDKQAEVRHKHSINKVLVYSLCQDLLSCFLRVFVRNACSFQAFNLKLN